MIRFGPAGWDYPDWRGRVYPKPAPRGFDPLAYLARWFDTVEVNSTFYRPARPEVARAWCERVAAHSRFRFTAKLWRRLTHEREAYGREEVAAARGALDALDEAGRLGAVLVQFPWSFKREEASLEWLEGLWSALAGLPLVLEVRHASWNAAETYDELAERGIGFVNVDQPLFRRSIGPSAVATSRVGYVRVHGRNYRNWFREKAGRDERYDYLYTSDELAPWAERTRSLAEAPGVEDVYVVTNNHFRGQAVANAAMLESMVEERPVAAPPELVASYREVLARYVAPEAGQQRLF
ncbi:MAG TPA: DUF72 domain-containing protein [Anaeromyxobacteraceae bacterium]|nr:DUF72 domain-containing protein [Anaeromyxobacteraceae bacterium]